MKTIKFNLICDGNPIRTIDDLQNNFVIDDIIEYYRNGLLQRWLRVRGYEEELQRVETIADDLTDIEIIKRLIDIFEIEKDKSIIDEDIYIWTFKKKRKRNYELFKEIEQSRDDVLNTYLKGYQEECARIFINPNDASSVKSAIKVIADNYYWILERDYWTLFNKLIITNCNFAILCLIANEKTRNLFLPIIVKGNDGNELLDINTDSVEGILKNIMFGHIKDIIKDLEKDKTELLGGNIKRCDMICEDWRPISEKGTKCMILSLRQKDRVRPIDTKKDEYEYGYPTGEKDHCLNISDDINKFKIFDGFEYRTITGSKSSNRGLIYMEV